MAPFCSIYCCVPSHRPAKIRHSSRQRRRADRRPGPRPPPPGPARGPYRHAPRLARLSRRPVSAGDPPPARRPRLQDPGRAAGPRQRCAHRAPTPAPPIVGAGAVTPCGKSEAEGFEPPGPLRGRWFSNARRGGSCGVLRDTSPAFPAVSAGRLARPVPAGAHGAPTVRPWLGRGRR